MAVIQWRTSYHKNGLTAVSGAKRHDVVCDNVMFSIELMTTLKAIKSHFKVFCKALYVLNN